MNNFSYCSFVSIHYIICECGDTFPTEKFLQEHLDNEHKSPCDETNEYQCSTCGKIFATERACMVHQQVHLRAYKVKSEVRDDSKSKKKYYTTKNIVCEVCGKRYASNAALRYHQRVHTGERPYHCSMCPKTFTMPLFLQIHVRTHTGERPYECPHCPKAFSNKAALLRHDRVHTGVKPYECPRCGKFFTQSNSMKLHVKTVHLKMPTPYKSKSRKAKQALKHANMITNVIAKEVRVSVPVSKPTPVTVSVSRPTTVSVSRPTPVTVSVSRPTLVTVNTEEDAHDEHRVKSEAQECDQEELEGTETYAVYEPNGEEMCREVKVEISEIPDVVYEDDLDQSEVVYEEVYEMDDDM